MSSNCSKYFCPFDVGIPAYKHRHGQDDMKIRLITRIQRFASKSRTVNTFCSYILMIFNLFLERSVSRIFIPILENSFCAERSTIIRKTPDTFFLFFISIVRSTLIFVLLRLSIWRQSKLPAGGIFIS